jgi:transcriptional regulator with XRE-family HTH domain
VETLGQRLARLRKARGLTQTQLAGKLDLIQAMISDYESDRRRMHAELIVRVARALEVSADELLGMKPSRSSAAAGLSLKFTRRLLKIETLSPVRQKALLQTIDMFVRDAERSR